MEEYDNLEFDFDAMLQDIKPNLLSPNLAEITKVPNDKKPKVVANLLVRAMHASLTKPVTKDILHEGNIHKITYFDIEPLMTGVWPMMSLMLLNISYGEQVTLIESLYPEKMQLTAKAFAINFTPDVSTTNIKIENDSEIVDKLDSANAGIATIISMLRDGGNPMPHPDKVSNELLILNKLVNNARERDAFVEATKHAQEAAKSRDGGVRR